MTHRNDHHPESETEMGRRPPEASWLRDLLRASRSALHRSVLAYCREEPSAEFAVRCAEAARVAVALAKLGAERERIGFAPLAIRDYLKSLAQGAQVALEPVLRWAGVADLWGVPAQLAGGWARLAEGIGMGVSEALQHFRISFAELRSGNAFSASLARAASAREQAEPLAEAELAFQHWARRLKPAEREELQTAEAQIRAYFEVRQHP